MINTTKNTARSKKEFKAIVVTKSKKIHKKFTNKYSTATAFITKYEKKSKKTMWFIYSYRPKLKSYRLYNRSANSEK